MIMGRRSWAAAVCGVALGLVAVVAIDGVAGAADGGAEFTVSASQLRVNQKISQASVRRSNRALNYLAPIRTTASDGADDGTNGVTPLSRIPGSGRGWTSEQIGDGAITGAELGADAVSSAKIAPGGVAAEDLAAGAVRTPSIAEGAITEARLDADVADGLAFFAHVTGGGVLEGNRGFAAATLTPDGVYRLATRFPISTQGCAVQVTPDDGNPDFGYYGKYEITGANSIAVRIYYEDGTLDNEPFSITVHCA